jgi:hypothetical protein
MPAFWSRGHRLPFIVMHVVHDGKVAQVLQRYQLRPSESQATYGWLHHRDWQDYGAALLITFGCALFPLTGSVSAKTTLRSAAVGGLPSHIFGAILMVTYLAFDGFTSTWQVRKRLTHSAFRSCVTHRPTLGPLCM